MADEYGLDPPEYDDGYRAAIQNPEECAAAELATIRYDLDGPTPGFGFGPPPRPRGFRAEESGHRHDHLPLVFADLAALQHEGLEPRREEYDYPRGGHELVQEQPGFGTGRTRAEAEGLGQRGLERPGQLGSQHNQPLSRAESAAPRRENRMPPRRCQEALADWSSLEVTMGQRRGNKRAPCHTEMKQWQGNQFSGTQHAPATMWPIVNCV
jgi:hypothetical protein